MINTMERTSTWNEIGKNISNCSTVEEILNHTGLNYTVSKQPITLANGTPITNKCATVKDNGEYINVVSNKYQICQNIDAFNFIDTITNDIKFVKAGETKSGLVYIIGQLPEVSVLGDSFEPYLIFQNGHNGHYTLKTTICPLRIVCQNQFNMSFNNSPNTISIQHSSLLQSRMTQAHQLLKDAVVYMDKFKVNAENLATTKISYDKALKIINSFFVESSNATEKQKEKIELQRDELYNAYCADDNQNFIGTAWGLINGFSDYITHKSTKKTANQLESKFLSVTLDPKQFNKFKNHVTNYIQ